MENITRLLVTATVLTLVTTAARAVPTAVSGIAPRQVPIVREVRLVCDQNCRCWRTDYHQRRHDWQRVDNADPNYCQGGGHYNGYYRSGPSIGLGFESRFAARSLPF